MNILEYSLQILEHLCVFDIGKLIMFGITTGVCEFFFFFLRVNLVNCKCISGISDKNVASELRCTSWKRARF